MNAIDLAAINDRLDRIERVLTAQLTDQRTRLDSELTYAQGRAWPNEQHIRIIGERLEKVNQQLAELGD